MTSSAGLVLLLLLGAAVLVWLLRRPRQEKPRAHPDDDSIDRATLAEAEEEVRDLDAFLAPQDADDELPDWGPGAPKG